MELCTAQMKLDPNPKQLQEQMDAAQKAFEEMEKQHLDILRKSKSSRQEWELQRTKAAAMSTEERVEHRLDKQQTKFADMLIEIMEYRKEQAKLKEVDRQDSKEVQHYMNEFAKLRQHLYEHRRE